MTESLCQYLLLQLLFFKSYLGKKENKDNLCSGSYLETSKIKNQSENNFA